MNLLPQFSAQKMENQKFKFRGVRLIFWSSKVQISLRARYAKFYRACSRSSVLRLLKAQKQTLKLFLKEDGRMLLHIFNIVCQGMH
jgi:hypothetical protein